MRQNKTTGIVFIAIALLSSFELYRLYSSAVYYPDRVRCPRSTATAPTFNLSQVNCQSLCSGSHVEVCRWKNYHHTLTPYNRSRCDNKAFSVNSNSKNDFPLAYSIMAHKDIYHLQRLLPLIYKSENIYCVHIDKKSRFLVEDVKNWIRCLDLKNVFLAKNLETVYWGGFSVLRATLNCLDELLEKSNKWKYFINLSAQDFPLKTNKKIVGYLKRSSQRNHIEVLPEPMKHRYQYKHRPKFDRLGFPDVNERLAQRHAPPPLNMTVFKG